MELWVYFKSVWGQAVSETWRDATGSSWPNRIVQVMLVVVPLIVGFAWHKLRPDDPLGEATYSGALWAMILALAAFGAIVVLFFLWHLLFAVPYRMWKEQKARADQLEAAEQSRRAVTAPRPALTDADKVRCSEALNALDDFIGKCVLGLIHDQWQSRQKLGAVEAMIQINGRPAEVTADAELLKHHHSPCLNLMGVDILPLQQLLDELNEPIRKVAQLEGAPENELMDDVKMDRGLAMNKAFKDVEDEALRLRNAIRQKRKEFLDG